jgi:hypothetical protein
MKPVPIGAALLLVLTALPAKADKCDHLAPQNAQNVDESFKGKIDGELKGIISRLAGGAASIEGEYRKIEVDELRNYPDSNKLYVWDKIIYLACVSPDLKIDINELFKLYLSGPPKTFGVCPPNMQPAPHEAVGIENDRSAVGEEYSDTANGIYNFCTVVGKESATAPQPKDDGGKIVYRVPKADPSGIPCQLFVNRHEVALNIVIGQPGLNLFDLPPGTCIVDQIVTKNWGVTVTNKDVTVTNQTSSGNHPN